jgi:ABC-type Fe3+ transport system permease subunit
VSSFFRTLSESGAGPSRRLGLNPWTVALGVLAVVLVLGGLITVAVGLGTMEHFEDFVLGQDEKFDSAVATAVVGGVAILLGIVVGTCWLVLGAVKRERRSR